MQLRKSFGRITVKVGSSLLSSKSGPISLKYLENIISQISLLMDQNKEVVLVSSGAIACGMSLLRLPRRPKDIAGLQAAAAVGQNELMGIYRKLLAPKRRLCAQLLVTWEDFENRQRYLNVKHTLQAILRDKILPIINENDTVSTSEIRFGDNDKLSALVASLIDSELLLILSDVDGLYRLPKKELISVVNQITPQIARLCSNTDKQACVGGMSAKIEAIQELAASGIPCIIANGRYEDTILKAADGEAIGTLFPAKGASLQAKKRWIAYGARPRGSIIVDDGAKIALVKHARSLLAPGVIGLRNDFKAHDIVSVVDKSDIEFARGIVTLSARELELHKGKIFKREVIHRDNLVIL